MRIGWYVALAIAALLIGGLAQAAPKVLSSTQLDRVAAGEATATDTDGSIVVDGGPDSTHTVVGAEADTGGIATYGYENFTLQLDGNIAIGLAAAGDHNEVSVIDQSDTDYAMATGDNADIAITFNALDYADVDDGSVAIAGDNNHVTTDYAYTDIRGDIKCGGYGVIAETADVDGAFNADEVDTTVCAEIDRSFNVTTNSASISGQCGSSTIALANAFGLQTLGVNLNVTDAETSGPATFDSNTALTGLAETCIVQGVVNCGGFNVASKP